MACVVACVEAAADAVVVGVRPVTDTVKLVEDGYVGSTLDREGLLQVVSPVVLPPAVVAALDGLPTSDLAALVALLAGTYPVTTLEAPPEARAGQRRGRPAAARGTHSRSARPTSSGNVILRLRALLGTAATRPSA